MSLNLKIIPIEFLLFSKYTYIGTKTLLSIFYKTPRSKILGAFRLYCYQHSEPKKQTKLSTIVACLYTNRFSLAVVERKPSHKIFLTFFPFINKTS